MGPHTVRHPHSFVFKMKHSLTLSVIILLLCPTVWAQKGNKVEKFINSYEAFVTEVVTTPYADFHGDTLTKVKRQQRCFMRRYRWYYDNRMSEEQLERFNQLCGRYHKKMSSLKNRRRWAIVKGRVKGRFENLFKRNNEPDIDTLPIDTIPYMDN